MEVAAARDRTGLSRCARCSSLDLRYEEAPAGPYRHVTVRLHGSEFTTEIEATS